MLLTAGNLASIAAAVTGLQCGRDSPLTQHGYSKRVPSHFWWQRSGFPSHSSLYMLNNPSAERVDRTVQALTLAFHGDPVYTWLLHTFDSSDHDSVRRELLRAFFTQCALNDGIFIEVDNYGSCGLLIPPGAAAENSWTLLQAGIVPALWNIGLGTFKVLPSFLNFHMVRILLKRCLYSALSSSTRPPLSV